MRHLRLLLPVLSACVLSATIALPARAQTAPQSQPAQELLKATITGVEGLVQVRDAEGQPWRKATVGMVVTEDAEFRTGPKSAVRFTIPPDQTITLDRLGTVKLLQAVKQNGKIITNLGMKYGRTRYDIEAAGQEHESTIKSPSSTLAVRGTKVSLYDQRPFNVEAVSLTGAASFRDGKKQLAFGGKNQGKTKVTPDQPDAASVSLDQAVIDPTLVARTESENRLVDVLLSRGSTVSYDQENGIKVVRGGVPPTDSDLIPALPGQLNFVLRWNTNADLNLSIGSPGGANNAGEFLTPIAGLSRNASGGRMDFDHRGGPNGGIEIAYWSGAFPEGLYGVGIVLASGSPTNAIVDTFVGGRRVQIFDGTGLVDTANVFVLPPTPGISEGTLAGIVGIGVDVPGVSSGVSTEPLGATTDTSTLQATSLRTGVNETLTKSTVSPVTPSSVQKTETSATSGLSASPRTPRATATPAVRANTRRTGAKK